MLWYRKIIIPSTHGKWVVGNYRPGIISTIPQVDQHQFLTVQTDSHQMCRHHHQQKCRQCATGLQQLSLSEFPVRKIHKLDLAHHQYFLAHTNQNNITIRQTLNLIMITLHMNNQTKNNKTEGKEKTEKKGNRLDHPVSEWASSWTLLCFSPPFSTLPTCWIFGKALLVSGINIRRSNVQHAIWSNIMLFGHFAYIILEP